MRFFITSPQIYNSMYYLYKYTDSSHTSYILFDVHVSDKEIKKYEHRKDFFAVPVGANF